MGGAMKKTTVNEDGSIGPFTDTIAAQEWLAHRLSMLCLLTGQKGTPEAHVVAVDTSGHECMCPAIYDSGIDTVRMQYTPTEGDVFDAAAVDGMLLHALGHRARRARARALSWFGWALAGLGIVLASVLALRDDYTPLLLTTLVALTALELLQIGLLVRFRWTAETSADAYALEHGGPRPILTFLRRMTGDPVSESALPHARPASRIARIQARLWAGSTLAADMPVHRYGEPDRMIG